jgi:hypothetical protein
LICATDDIEKRHFYVNQHNRRVAKVIHRFSPLFLDLTAKNLSTGEYSHNYGMRQAGNTFLHNRCGKISISHGVALPWKENTVIYRLR